LHTIIKQTLIKTLFFEIITIKRHNTILKTIERHNNTI
jgi:hypothetical protein